MLTIINGSEIISSSSDKPNIFSNILAPKATLDNNGKSLHHFPIFLSQFEKAQDNTYQKPYAKKVTLP